MNSSKEEVIIQKMKLKLPIEIEYIKKLQKKNNKSLFKVSEDSAFLRLIGF